MKNKPSTLKINTETTYFKNYVNENPFSNIDPANLKGGYYLFSTYDKQLQYLILKHNQIIVDTIYSCSIGLPFKTLGYIYADLEKNFVLLNHIGSSNVVSFLQKENGDNLIPDWSYLIGIDTKKEILLFSKEDTPFKKEDSLTLFDMNNFNFKNYPFPKEIFYQLVDLNKIKLLDATDTSFTIEYELNRLKKLKTSIYKR